MYLLKCVRACISTQIFCFEYVSSFSQKHFLNFSFFFPQVYRGLYCTTTGLEIIAENLFTNSKM